MLMQALGPRAFAGKNAECTRLTNAIEALSKLLNPPSHHQDDPARAILDRKMAGERVAEILTTANTLGLHSAHR